MGGGYTLSLENHQKIFGKSIKQGYDQFIADQFNVARDSSYHRTLQDKKGNRIWGDAKYKFILKRDNKFAAVIGFEPAYRSVVVVQIQGVPNGKELLKEIKWSSALLDVVGEWGKVNALEKIFVLPHERNHWSEVNTNQFGAKMYYNITPKRKGFKLNKDDLYEKSLI